MNHDDNHAAALSAEETAARDTYDRLRLECGALHRRFGTWVEAHEATAARVQAGEFSPFSREWFESVARFVKAAELDQAPAPVTGWTVVSRQDGQTYYAPTGVEDTSREEAEEAAWQLAMMHGPTAPFWHTVTFYAVPSQAEQAYANDPDHLTVGARRWPILWAHKATYSGITLYADEEGPDEPDDWRSR